MTPTEFALNAIKPYYKNPYIIPKVKGHSSQNGYLSVIARYVKKEPHLLHDSYVPYHIIGGFINQKDIMIDEAVDMLSVHQWDFLFFLEKAIGFQDVEVIKKCVTRLNLFTYEDLVKN